VSTRAATRHAWIVRLPARLDSGLPERNGASQRHSQRVVIWMRARTALFLPVVVLVGAAL
jgi:hypothetical protein